MPCEVPVTRKTRGLGGAKEAMVGGDGLRYYKRVRCYIRTYLCRIMFKTVGGPISICCRALA